MHVLITLQATTRTRKKYAATLGSSVPPRSTDAFFSQCTIKDAERQRWGCPGFPSPCCAVHARRAPARESRPPREPPSLARLCAAVRARRPELATELVHHVGRGCQSPARRPDGEACATHATPPLPFGAYGHAITALLPAATQSCQHRHALCAWRDTIPAPLPTPSPHRCSPPCSPPLTPTLTLTLTLTLLRMQI